VLKHQNIVPITITELRYAALPLTLMTKTRVCPGIEPRTNSMQILCFSTELSDHISRLDKIAFINIV